MVEDTLRTSKVGNRRNVWRRANGIVGKLGVGDCVVGGRETDEVLGQNNLVVEGRGEARVVLKVGGPKRATVIRVGRQEIKGRVPGVARNPEVNGIGFEGCGVCNGNSPGKSEKKKNGVTSTNYSDGDEKNTTLPAQGQDRVCLVERTRILEAPRELQKVNHAAAVGDQFVLS
ncbi:MAG: hypothetical protein BJ554DRAFT_3431 [Olpidium bornovanus]|uniref:Uncharacterized protein n=1 Tax=Olpidium bornovanus TaxID=278681 RepID=A0A8H8DM22_9FUNG|nr:MAG: hypothetical protein BJ554DRAFT_3431 [Olpidium bornovanus]